MSKKSQLLCAWCGPALGAIFLVGFIFLAGFFPTPSPSKSAAQIVTFYESNLTGIRIGMALFMVAAALIAPWGAVIAFRTKRTEEGAPIWTYVQLVCVATGTALGTMIPLIWGAAAYRPGAISPEITQAFNDFGWIAFLFPAPPFMVWHAAIAIPILTNKSEHPLFPRWFAYFNFLIVLAYLPAFLILFSKRGFLAYDSWFVNYFPLACFFVWMSVMTIVLIKAINHDDVQVSEAHIANSSDQPSVLASVSSEG